MGMARSGSASTDAMTSVVLPLQGRWRQTLWPCAQEGKETEFREHAAESVLAVNKFWSTYYVQVGLVSMLCLGLA